MHASIAKSLFSLFVIFEWIDECKESFNKLKNNLILSQKILTPNWNKASMSTSRLPILQLFAY